MTFTRATSRKRQDLKKATLQVWTSHLRDVAKKGEREVRKHREGSNSKKKFQEYFYFIDFVCRLEKLKSVYLPQCTLGVHKYMLNT